MLDRQWLNQDQHFAPGRELFRCARGFAIWAYTISYSQLLLRARTTEADGRQQTRIDVLFKPAMRLDCLLSGTRIMPRICFYNLVAGKCRAGPPRHPAAMSSGLAWNHCVS
jgi:hypothetical protein